MSTNVITRRPGTPEERVLLVFERAARRSGFYIRHITQRSPMKSITQSLGTMTPNESIRMTRPKNGCGSLLFSPRRRDRKEKER